VPIYEYECDQQRHRFEKWQSIQDESVKTCPTCGSPVHKIFHPTGIIFKGSGWYVTDNRKSSDSGEKTVVPKAEAKTDKPTSEAKPGSDKKD
jgi:putative FmdB family regulatory protein